MAFRTRLRKKFIHQIMLDIIVIFEISRIFWQLHKRKYHLWKGQILSFQNQFISLRSMKYFKFCGNAKLSTRKKLEENIICSLYTFSYISGI